MSKCQICGEEFDNFRQLNGHMNKHRPKPDTNRDLKRWNLLPKKRKQEIFAVRLSRTPQITILSTLQSEYPALRGHSLSNDIPPPEPYHRSVALD